jgi:outer membrane cobalamin receptor
MGWGTYSNSPTMYLGLPSQGNLNIGLVGILQRDIRGEKSGLDDAYLKTWFLENEFKVNEKLNLFSRVVYRETGTANDSYVYVTADGTKMLRVPITSYSNRISAELSANYTLSDKHNFSGGVQFFQDNVEAGARRTTVDFNTIYLLDGRDTLLNLNATFLPRVFDIRNNFGGYLQYALKTDLLKKTNFTFGGRYDYNSYFGSAVSPRIAIVNQPSKKFTFKLQFGEAFRAPTNLEIYQTPGRNFPLKKEKIKAYEVNAIFSPSNNLRLQLNGFRNELSDVIIISNLSGLTPNKNPGAFTINGVEGILDIVVSKNISGFANFTYQHAWGKNLVTGNSGKLPGVASIKGNAGITVHVSDDLFIVSVSENWVGDRNSPRTDPYGTVKGYFLTNCVISTGKLFKDKVRASLDIHNLFNTKWLDPGFRTADGLLYATVLEQPGINGLFKIGISL